MSRAGWTCGRLPTGPRTQRWCECNRRMCTCALQWSGQPRSCGTCGTAAGQNLTVRSSDICHVECNVRSALPPSDAGLDLTSGCACLPSDAAAMARQVSAAEQAAQDAVAEANALRSALFEAEAANRDLHAQLRALAPRRDAANAFARHAYPLFARKVCSFMGAGHAVPGALSRQAF